MVFGFFFLSESVGHISMFLETHGYNVPLETRELRFYSTVLTVWCMLTSKVLYEIKAGLMLKIFAMFVHMECFCSTEYFSE